jgi:hypothetical protein
METAVNTSSTPYEVRPFALSFLTSTEITLVRQSGNYFSFLLERPELASGHAARFIRCVQGRQPPTEQHELAFLKLLHINSYEQLQFRLDQARALSQLLQSATLLEFPKCWDQLSKGFSTGHPAKGLNLYRFALSRMTSSELHAFAHSLQILCARFAGIRFATIYCVHYLAAAAGNIASRDWIAEQDLPDAEADYFSYYCGGQRRTNKDSASTAANRYHIMHAVDGNQETALNPEDVTDFEREQLRFDGGAGSQYWDAD